MIENNDTEKIKFLKFLKALDNPIRLKIIEFVLNYKEGDNFLVPPKETSLESEASENG